MNVDLQWFPGMFLKIGSFFFCLFESCHLFRLKILCYSWKEWFFLPSLLFEENAVKKTKIQ